MGDLAALPTVTVTVDGETVTLPDWSQISLKSLGTIDVAGIIDHEFDDLIGYEFGRVWEAGAELAEVLKFGDLAEAWELGELTLNVIGELAGVDISQLSLNEIGFLKDLSVEDLIEKLPDDVLEAAELVGDAAEIAGEAFGILDGGITLKDVPALTKIALKEFPEIKDFFLEAIPFLDQIPLDKILKTIEKIPSIVRLDALYGNPEGFTFNTISGPGPSPKPKPPEDCDGGNCPHVETFLPGNILPGRWVSGEAQKVDGGFGPLKAVGGGKEPTGRLPFGNSLKVALWKIDSVSDTVETRIFFRACAKIPFFGKTCTPYNLPPGGIPFINFSRDNYIPA